MSELLYNKNSLFKWFPVKKSIIYNNRKQFISSLKKRVLIIQHIPFRNFDYIPLLQVIYKSDDRQLVLSLINKTISFKSSIWGHINTAIATLNRHINFEFREQIGDNNMPDKEIEDTIYIAEARLSSWEITLISLQVRTWQAGK